MCHLTAQCRVYINPCPAGPGYIRFSPNKMPLKFIKYPVVDAQLIKYFNLGDIYFSKIKIFLVF